MPPRPVPLTTWNRFQSSTLATDAQGLLDGLQKQLEEATAPLQIPQAPQMPSLPTLQPLSEWTKGWGEQEEPEAAPTQAPAQQQQQPSWMSGLPSLDDLTKHWQQPEPAQRSGPSAPSGTPSAMPTGAPAGDGDEDDETYIRRAAAQRGIDPDTAVRVANTEGGAGRGGRARQNMQGAPAFGHFQLYIGGPQNGAMGDEALAAGIDPRDPKQWRRAIDFALDKALERGWQPFQGAAAAGIGDWDGIGGKPSSAPAQPSAPAAQRPAPLGPATGQAPSPLGDKEYYPRQDLLDDPDKWAVCGPLGVMAFAAMKGQPVTYEQAKEAARAAGWSSAGMKGPQSQVAALRNIGIAARTGAIDIDLIRREVQNGNPVGLSSPGETGHYFTVQAVDDQGRMDLGNSALALKASGGRRWFTLDELRALGAIGNVDTAIYMDNPASPTPSVAVADPNASPASPSPSAGAAAPAAAGASQPAAATPLASIGVGEPQTQAAYGDVIPPAEPFDNRDADQGPREAIPGSVGAAPLPQPSGYNDPEVGGTVSQSVPYTPPQSSVGPGQGPDIGTRGAAVPVGAGQSAPLPPVAVSPSDDPGGALHARNDAASTPPLQDDRWRDESPREAIPGSVGASLTARDVQTPDELEQVGAGFRRTDPFLAAANAVPAAAQAAGSAAATQAMQGPDFLDTVLPAPAQALRRGVNIYQAGQGAAGEVIGRAVDDALASPDDEVLGTIMGVPVTRKDLAGFMGQVLLDPTNLLPAGQAKPIARGVGRAAREAVDVARPVVREGVQAAGRFGRELAEEGAERLMGMTPMPTAVQRGGGGIEPRLPVRRVQPAEPIPCQKPITLTPSEEVSRLRLDKFPEEVRADIEQAAKGINWAHEQRRGVLPDAVVQQMAADDLRSADQLIKQGKIGKAYNAEETAALRNAVASQAQIVRELSDDIADARAANTVPDLLIARRAAEATKLDGLVKIAEGARAEAGRTLRAYRQQANLIEMNPNQAIERIYKKLGGRDNAAEAVDEYTQMVKDGANPIQLAKFWAGIESGKITGSDLFSLYRRFNMLSGPRTLEVNALSGLVNLGYEVAGAGVGQAARGRFGEAASEVIAPLKASGRAFKNMAETMWHGVSMEQAARGDIPRNLSSRTDNPLAKGVITAMEIPDRFNSGVDQFFRTMTEDWAATRLAHQQARGENLTPRSPGWAEAVAKHLETIRDDPSKFPMIQKMADRVTFSEEPGGIVKWLEDGKRKFPNLIGFITPFVRTPANIASRAVDLSPLGPVRTAIEAGTGLGRGREMLPERIRDNAIGIGATMWAYDQAQKGNITGAGPDDPEKLAALRATGWQPFSIKIKDQYWSYANFAPFSLALSMGAAAHEAKQYAKPGKDDAVSMIADGAERTGKVITDMTVVAGIGAIIKSIQDPERYGGRWLSQSLQQLMPAGSLVNTVGQATDDVMRRAERDTFANQVTGDLKARVPGLRQQVPAAQDPLGRPVPNEQTGLGALNPFRPTTERPDATLQQFIDAGVDIGKPKETLTVRAGTAPIALTPAEQRRWNELRGAQLTLTSPKLSASPGFQAANKPGREIVMKRVLNTASEAADRQLMSEIGNAELSRRMREAAAKKAS